MAFKLKLIFDKWYKYCFILLIFFSWMAQFIVEIQEVKQSAVDHGQVFEWSNFWVKFWSSTLQNWQSKFLQLFTFVVLTAYLIHKNSHESRDSEERIEKSSSRVCRLCCIFLLKAEGLFSLPIPKLRACRVLSEVRLPYLFQSLDVSLQQINNG